MPTNSWSESDSCDELEAVDVLLSDLSEADEELDGKLYRGFEGRRSKAAVVLTAIWSGTIVLHLVSWGYWFVLGLTTLIGIHALRLILARPLPIPEPLFDEQGSSEKASDQTMLPYVSLLVAAKNEEAVIENLVKTLCNLDYPVGRYDLWVINDNSTDQTAVLLDQLAQEYEQLNVIHRAANAGGGKSGALNQAWPLAEGEILAVFDADAQVPPDLLRRVLPLFERDQIGAVQVRKAILQAEDSALKMRSNFWIQGQKTEMVLDAFFQQQRIAIGGIGELRGNGQFVRRQALKSCGGWNEQTITDDLDLTLQLHLQQWDIDFLLHPAVKEEGVTRAISLWHQRNRWAEGGYQRYLDYWRLILRNRMSVRKKIDLLLFWLIQYCVPTAAVPDFLMAIARNRPPILSPLTGLTLTLSLIGMVVGLRRIQKDEKNRAKSRNPKASFSPFFLLMLLQVLPSAIYMLHWIPVVSSTTIRMSIRPKRLKWVKTIHQGHNNVWMKMPEDSEKTA